MNKNRPLKMTRIIFTILFAFFLQTLSIFAKEYKTGDIIKTEGISYKVLVTYLVTDAKESPDTIQGPDKFYQGGELMVIKVDEDLDDVVIPTSVGRFVVVGLTDSLFYNHTHNRIWLPELQFAGNRCFAGLTMRSGALVLHDIKDYGRSVFDGTNADIIFDIRGNSKFHGSFSKDTIIYSANNRPVKTTKTYLPNGMIKTSFGMMKLLKDDNVINNCITAGGENYKRWINKAFNNDEEFQKNNLTDKNEHHSKKSYATEPYSSDKGLVITAYAKREEWFPCGNLTERYIRVPQYRVYNKKTKKQTIYKEFLPIADATEKDGWHLKFTGDRVVEYKLNGKMIK